MLLTHSDGIPAGPEETEQLTNAGYLKCYNPKCNFHISPEAQQKVLNEGSGYYTCPKQGCYQSHDIMEDMPWHGVPEEFEGHFNEENNQENPNVPTAVSFSPGGGTRIGIGLEEQGQIGEDLIKEMGNIPGYGPITWWHPGGAGTHSPLDAATSEWGVEIKTIGYDATHHRFIPGRPKERADKNEAAKKMGLKGILGVLVLLNYRTSEADVYVKEMPLAPWQTGRGATLQGVASFRTNTAQHLIERVPFHNPLMDPHNPAPHEPTPAPSDIPF